MLRPMTVPSRMLRGANNVVVPWRCGVNRRPTRVDAYVAVSPAQLAESLRECSDTSLSYRVVGGRAYQHANPPEALILLRAGRYRPRGHRAAEQRDELPPLHSITS